jgi:ferredoxin
MLVINPDECIDCGVCEPECPVEAIKPEAEDLLKWVELNREYAPQWPNITVKKPAPPDADSWKEAPNKFEEHFSPEPGGK